MNNVFIATRQPRSNKSMNHIPEDEVGYYVLFLIILIGGGIVFIGLWSKYLDYLYKPKKNNDN